MLKKIMIVLASIATLSTLLGAGFIVDGHFAKETPTSASFAEVRSDIVMVSARIDAMKLEDELLLVKKKMYGLEDRWGKKFKEENDRYYHTIKELLAFMPEEYRDEYRELEDERDDLEKQIEEKNKVQKKGE